MYFLPKKNNFLFIDLQNIFNISNIFTKQRQNVLFDEVILLIYK